MKRNWKETKRLGGRLLEEDTIGCAFSCAHPSCNRGNEFSGTANRARGAITWKEFDGGGLRGMFFI